MKYVPNTNLDNEVCPSVILIIQYNLSSKISIKEACPDILPLSRFKVAITSKNMDILPKSREKNVSDQYIYVILVSKLEFTIPDFKKN